MKYTSTGALMMVVLLTACHQPVMRKVVVMAHGKIIVSKGTVEVKEGTGYAEEQVDVEGVEAVQWNVKTSQGNSVVKIPEEKGVYILNLKKDTLIGSLQLLGVDISSRHVISQEELKWKIDSLIKLTKGDNVLFGGRNYFIIPGQLIKISPNIKAKIYGPFTLISSSIEVDQDENVPEIYKFYTNTEMRQLIGKFEKMTR